VDRPLIPHQDHRTAQVSKQVAEKRSDIEPGEIPGPAVEIEGQPASFRGDREGADDRDAVLLVEVIDDRSPASRRPGATDVGNEQEPAFVQEDEMGPKCALVFYPRPFRSFPPLDGRFVPLERPPLGLLATPPEAGQELPHMAGVVLNAKFSVDHLGHALERPEVRPIPGSQGTPEEHRDQVALLGVGQLGRAARRGLRLEPPQPFLPVRLVPPEH